MKIQIALGCALGAALMLSGCSTVENLGTAFNVAAGFTVTQSELDAARAGYDGLFLVPVSNYRNLGFCAAGTKATLAKPCADKSTTLKLAAADAVVNAAFSNVQSMISSGNNTGISAAYGALQQAISSAEQLAATYGVK